MDDDFDPRLHASEWFDLWHWHPALARKAMPGPDSRHEQIRTLFAAWERIEEIAGRLTRPRQSWLVIVPAEPGQDAVYLHTPNPNRENFPYRFEGVAWGAAAPEELAEFVSDPGVEFGRSESGEFVLYWVRRATVLG